MADPSRETILRACRDLADERTTQRKSGLKSLLRALDSPSCISCLDEGGGERHGTPRPASWPALLAASAEAVEAEAQLAASKGRPIDPEWLRAVRRALAAARGSRDGAGTGGDGDDARFRVDGPGALGSDLGGASQILDDWGCEWRGSGGGDGASDDGGGDDGGGQRGPRALPPLADAPRFAVASGGRTSGPARSRLPPPASGATGQACAAPSLGRHSARLVTLATRVLGSGAAPRGTASRSEAVALARDLAAPQDDAAARPDRGSLVAGGWPFGRLASASLVAAVYRPPGVRTTLDVPRARCTGGRGQVTAQPTGNAPQSCASQARPGAALELAAAVLGSGRAPRGVGGGGAGGSGLGPGDARDRLPPPPPSTLELARELSAAAALTAAAPAGDAARGAPGSRAAWAALDQLLMAVGGGEGGSFARGTAVRSASVDAAAFALARALVLAGLPLEGVAQLADELGPRALRATSPGERDGTGARAEAAREATALLLLLLRSRGLPATSPGGWDAAEAGRWLSRLVAADDAPWQRTTRGVGSPTDALALAAAAAAFAAALEPSEEEGAGKQLPGGAADGAAGEGPTGIAAGSGGGRGEDGSHDHKQKRRRFAGGSPARRAPTHPTRPPFPSALLGWLAASEPPPSASGDWRARGLALAAVVVWRYDEALGPGGLAAWLAPCASALRGGAAGLGAGDSGPSLVPLWGARLAGCLILRDPALGIAALESPGRPGQSERHEGTTEPGSAGGGVSGAAGLLESLLVLAENRAAPAPSRIAAADSAAAGVTAAAAGAEAARGEGDSSLLSPPPLSRLAVLGRALDAAVALCAEAGEGGGSSGCGPCDAATTLGGRAALAGAGARLLLAVACTSSSPGALPAGAGRAALRLRCSREAARAGAAFAGREGWGAGPAPWATEGGAEPGAAGFAKPEPPSAPSGVLSGPTGTVPRIPAELCSAAAALADAALAAAEPSGAAARARLAALSRSQARDACPLAACVAPADRQTLTLAETELGLHPDLERSSSRASGLSRARAGLDALAPSPGPSLRPPGKNARVYRPSDCGPSGADPDAADPSEACPTAGGHPCPTEAARSALAILKAALPRHGELQDGGGPGVGATTRLAAAALRLLRAASWRGEIPATGSVALPNADAAAPAREVVEAALGRLGGLLRRAACAGALPEPRTLGAIEEVAAEARAAAGPVRGPGDPRLGASGRAAPAPPLGAWLVDPVLGLSLGDLSQTGRLAVAVLAGALAAAQPTTVAELACSWLEAGGASGAPRTPRVAAACSLALGEAAIWASREPGDAGAASPRPTTPPHADAAVRPLSLLRRACAPLRGGPLGPEGTVLPPEPWLGACVDAVGAAAVAEARAASLECREEGGDADPPASGGEAGARASLSEAAAAAWRAWGQGGRWGGGGTAAEAVACAAIGPALLARLAACVAAAPRCLPPGPTGGAEAGEETVEDFESDSEGDGPRAGGTAKAGASGDPRPPSDPERDASSIDEAAFAAVALAAPGHPPAARAELVAPAAALLARWSHPERVFNTLEEVAAGGGGSGAGGGAERGGGSGESAAPGPDLSSRDPVCLALLAAAGEASEEVAIRAAAALLHLGGGPRASSAAARAIACSAGIPPGWLHASRRLVARDWVSRRQLDAADLAPRAAAVLGRLPGWDSDQIRQRWAEAAAEAEAEAEADAEDEAETEADAEDEADAIAGDVAGEAAAATDALALPPRLLAREPEWLAARLLEAARAGGLGASLNPALALKVSAWQAALRSAGRAGAPVRGGRPPELAGALERLARALQRAPPEPPLTPGAAAAPPESPSFLLSLQLRALPALEREARAAGARGARTAQLEALRALCVGCWIWGGLARGDEVGGEGGDGAPPGPGAPSRRREGWGAASPLALRLSVTCLSRALAQRARLPEVAAALDYALERCREFGDVPGVLGPAAPDFVDAVAATLWRAAMGAGGGGGAPPGATFPAPAPGSLALMHALRCLVADPAHAPFLELAEPVQAMPADRSGDEVGRTLAEAATAVAAARALPGAAGRRLVRLADLASSTLRAPPHRALQLATADARDASRSSSPATLASIVSVMREAADDARCPALAGLAGLLLGGGGRSGGGGRVPGAPAPLVEVPGTSPSPRRPAEIRPPRAPALVPIEIEEGVGALLETTQVTPLDAKVESPRRRAALRRRAARTGDALEGAELGDEEEPGSGGGRRTVELGPAPASPRGACGGSVSLEDLAVLSAWDDAQADPGDLSERGGEATGGEPRDPAERARREAPAEGGDDDDTSPGASVRPTWREALSIASHRLCDPDRVVAEAALLAVSELGGEQLLGDLGGPGGADAPSRRTHRALYRDAREAARALGVARGVDPPPELLEPSTWDSTARPFADWVRRLCAAALARVDGGEGTRPAALRELAALAPELARRALPAALEMAGARARREDARAREASGRGARGARLAAAAERGVLAHAAARPRAARLLLRAAAGAWAESRGSDGGRRAGAFLGLPGERFLGITPEALAAAALAAGEPTSAAYWGDLAAREAAEALGGGARMADGDGDGDACLGEYPPARLEPLLTSVAAAGADTDPDSLAAASRTTTPVARATRAEHARDWAGALAAHEQALRIARAEAEAGEAAEALSAAAEGVARCLAHLGCREALEGVLLSRTLPSAARSAACEAAREATAELGEWGDASPGAWPPGGPLPPPSSAPAAAASLAAPSAASDALVRALEALHQGDLPAASLLVAAGREAVRGGEPRWAPGALADLSDALSEDGPPRGRGPRGLGDPASPELLDASLSAPRLALRAVLLARAGRPAAAGLLNLRAAAIYRVRGEPAAASAVLERARALLWDGHPEVGPAPGGSLAGFGRAADDIPRDSTLLVALESSRQLRAAGLGDAAARELRAALARRDAAGGRGRPPPSALLASSRCQLAAWQAEARADRHETLLAAFRHASEEAVDAAEVGPGREPASDVARAVCECSFRHAAYLDDWRRRAEAAAAARESRAAAAVLAEKRRQLEAVRAELGAARRRGARADARESKQLRAEERALAETVRADGAAEEASRRARSAARVEALGLFVRALAVSDRHDRAAASAALRLACSCGAEDASEARRALEGLAPAKMLPLAAQVASRLGGGAGAPRLPAPLERGLEELLARIIAARPAEAAWVALRASRDGARREAARRACEAARAMGAEVGPILDGASRLSEAYLALARSPPPEAERALPVPADVERLARGLRDAPVPTAPHGRSGGPVGGGGGAPAFVGFAGFSGPIRAVGGVNRPKLVTVVGSDGRNYRQLVKSGSDDPRQDSIMGLFFDTASEALRESAEARRRGLRVRTYPVVPLSENVGIIGWVDGARPLMDVLVGPDRRGGAHGRARRRALAAREARGGPDAAGGARGGALPPVPPEFDDTWRSIAAGFSSASPEAKLATWLEVTRSFRPELGVTMDEGSPSPEAAFRRRLTYTRSTATASVAGHLIGLGDRHSGNVLLDSGSGEVVHIDLGVAFEQGRLLPVPELVPFRLTPDVVDGFGPKRLEGAFRRSAEASLAAARESREALCAIVEVLLHDPLWVWNLTAEQARKRQRRIEGVASPAPAAAATVHPPSAAERRDGARASPLAAARTTPQPPNASSLIGGNADAARALLRVRQKLSGAEDGAGPALSVEGQVTSLLQDATDPGRLSRMFPGWASWL